MIERVLAVLEEIRAERPPGYTHMYHDLIVARIEELDEAPDWSRTTLPGPGEDE